MLFIVEKAMAFVVEGFNPKKAVTVISEYNRQQALTYIKQLAEGQHY